LAPSIVVGELFRHSQQVIVLAFGIAYSTHQLDRISNDTHSPASIRSRSGGITT
jgi:hypothetical protein